MKKPLAVLACVATLSACGADRELPEVTWMEAAGMVGGAAVGGVVGWQFGGGIATYLYTAAGAISGGTAGFLAARKLSSSDAALHRRATQYALSTPGLGTPQNWQNPKTGLSGVVRTTRTVAATEGKTCRHFRSAVAFANGVALGNGVACAGRNGQWQIVSDEFS